MLRDDAERIATAIEEHFTTGDATAPSVRATVKSDHTSPSAIPAGAGRPVFIRYYIRVDDGTRAATLELGQAGAILDEAAPDWDTDRFFDAIRAREVPIEDSTAG
jgi:hypothetical protein